VDAPQVVPGAHGDAVLTRIAAGARAEGQMVIVQGPARRARRDCAAPAVARKDRVAWARLRSPLLVHVVEDAIEAPQEGSAGRVKLVMALRKRMATDTGRRT